MKVFIESDGNISQKNINQSVGVLSNFSTKNAYTHKNFNSQIQILFTQEIL